MKSEIPVSAPLGLRHSLAGKFKLAAVLATLVLNGLISTPARATVLWEADTSRGTSVFEGLETAPGDIGLVSDPKGLYGSVYRYRTWDDPAYQKERAESRGTKTSSGNFRPALGGTYFIGWRALWNPMPTNGSWVAFWQMHGYGPTGQGAPLVFRALGGDGNLYLQNNVNGTDVNFWNTPLRLNSWNTYVLQIHLATDNTGWVELWYNGVRQTFINGQQRFNCPTWDAKPGSYVLFKWGVYRSGSLNGSGDAAAYMSRARIGTTYADVAFDASAAAPTFTPGGGTYATPQSVTIATATSGASLRYTTDGSTPSATSGTVYTGPITIATTTTLKAIAYGPGLTDSAVASATYTIGSATTVNVEAENGSVTNSGTGTTVQTDANTSGGKWISLDAENTGSWMEFTTPSIPAGTYSLRLGYKTNNNRGIASVKVDGAAVGGTIDQYASPSTYPTATVGTVTFAASGTHKIRLTVTGKNSASSSYVLSADKFTFVSQ